MTTRRETVLGGVIVLLLALVVGMTAYVVTLRVEQVQRNTDDIEAIDQLLQVTLAVSDCTPGDTPSECRQRQVDRARVEGIGRVTEIDCRTRRALADLPALPPTVRCAESTPADVYPGSDPTTEGAP